MDLDQCHSVEKKYTCSCQSGLSVLLKLRATTPGTPVTFELFDAFKHFVGPLARLRVFGCVVHVRIPGEVLGGDTATVFMAADKRFFRPCWRKDNLLHENAFVPMVVAHEPVEHLHADVERIGFLGKGVALLRVCWNP